MSLLGEPATSVLAALERFGQENDAVQPDRARKMLNLERDTAELVFLLVRAAGRQRVLEVGTSSGYSTIWLALALEGAGGTPPLVSIERDPDKQQQAANALRWAGLDDRVSLVLGDATAAVADLPGPFDCVFFDADRISAPEQLRLLLPKLDPDCLLLADNALSHPGEVAGYRAVVESLPGFACTIVSVGKGLHVAVRKGGAIPSAGQ